MKYTHLILLKIDILYTKIHVLKCYNREKDKGIVLFLEGKILGTYMWELKKKQEQNAISSPGNPSWPVLE